MRYAVSSGDIYVCPTVLYLKQVTSAFKYKSTIIIYNCNGHRSLWADEICCGFKQLKELQLYWDLRYGFCSGVCSKGTNFFRSFLQCLLLPSYYNIC